MASWERLNGFQWNRVRGISLKGSKISQMDTVAGHAAVCVEYGDAHVVLTLDAGCSASSCEKYETIEALFEEHENLNPNVSFVASRHAVSVVKIMFATTESAEFGYQLYFFVVQSNGMAFSWLWNRNKCAWRYLNKFCFLKNQNLAWTKPVKDACVSSDRILPTRRQHRKDLHKPLVELWWWEHQEKQGSQLFCRKLLFLSQITNEKSVIQLGMATEAPMQLHEPWLQWHTSVRTGIWVIFPSSIWVRTCVLTRQWISHQLGDGLQHNSTMLWTIHAITGDLVSYNATDRQAHVYRRNDDKIDRLELCQLSEWKCQSVEGFKAHRHALLFLVDGSNSILVYSTLTGTLLQNIQLYVDIPCQMWSIEGVGASVGLYSVQGSYWTLRPPLPTHELKRLPNETSASVNDISRSMKSYPHSLRFQIVQRVLELLKSRLDQGTVCQKEIRKVWDMIENDMGNPLVLIAMILCSQNSTGTVPSYMLERVEKIIQSIDTILDDVTSHGDEITTKITYFTPLNCEMLKFLRELVQLQKKRHDLVQGRQPAPEFVEEDKTKIDADQSLWLRRQWIHRDVLDVISATFSQELRHELLEEMEIAFLNDESDPTANANSCPNHLLFHGERTLTEHLASSSPSLKWKQILTYVPPKMSKHMYFEILVRLYFQCQPQKLVEFIDTINRRCLPTDMTRNHYERALYYLPPVERVKRMDPASIKAYGLLLWRARCFLEASNLLLECQLYSDCKVLVLQQLKKEERKLSMLLYFKLVRHSAEYETTTELKTLLNQSPEAMDRQALVDLCSSLQQALPRRRPEIGKVTIQDVSSILLNIIN